MPDNAPKQTQGPSSQPEDGDERPARGTGFVAWWNAVLRDDPVAQAQAMNLVRAAVEPMLLRSFPTLDADDLTASIQRTVFRRLKEDPASVEAVSFEHFRNRVRKRARFKALNQRRRMAPVEFPGVEGDSEDWRIHEPVDHHEKNPVDQAIEVEFIDSLLESLRVKGEPIFTIVVGWMNALDDDEVVRLLREKGYSFSRDVVRSRRARVLKWMKRAMGQE